MTEAQRCWPTGVEHHVCEATLVETQQKDGYILTWDTEKLIISSEAAARFAKFILTCEARKQRTSK